MNRNRRVGALLRMAHVTARGKSRRALVGPGAGPDGGLDGGRTGRYWWPTVSGALLVAAALMAVVPAASTARARAEGHPWQSTAQARRLLVAGPHASWRSRGGRRAAEGPAVRGFARGAGLLSPDLFASIEPYAPPSIPVGANPGGIAVNAATHTVYVVNGSDDTVSVIDASACNAEIPAGCSEPAATIPLGTGPLQNGSAPLSAIISPDGATLYVVSPDGANSVAVINASTCNATITSGCAAGPVASVATGNGPLDLAEDPASQTLYVANVADNTVSVINAGDCRAQDTSGCGQVAPTVAVGNTPVALVVDPQAQTLYVANVGDDTVSVIGTISCNAGHPAGCLGPAPTQAVGGAPDAITTSDDGRTVYVANSGNGLNGPVLGGNTVSLIDATACESGHPQGCTSAPAPFASVGDGGDDQPQALAFDRSTNSVFVADSADDSVSVIDPSGCSAWHGACPRPAASVQSGANPVALAVIAGLHTVYVVDSADNAVAAIDDRACTNSRPPGCRPEPAASIQVARNDAIPPGSAIDPAAHTAYIQDDGPTGFGPSVLDLVNTRSCYAHISGGCASHPDSITLSAFPDRLGFDSSTGTLYASEGTSPFGANPGSPNELEVIATAHCNVTDTSGCAHRAVIPLGEDDSEGPVAVDAAIHTIYVGGSTAIAVIDTRHCNAADMSGCAHQPVGEITETDSVQQFAIAPDTLYGEFLAGGSLQNQGYVQVIDTRHCQGSDPSGCAGLAPATVELSSGSLSLALDPAHNTLYVPNNDEGNGPGAVSMINTSDCNGDQTGGCAVQPAATTETGRAPLAAGIDPATDTLYITNYQDASVFTYNTAACNAITQSGCRNPPPEITVGSGPDDVLVDDPDRTVYVPSYHDGKVSLLPTRR